MKVIDDRMLTAKPRKLKAEYTIETAHELRRQYGMRRMWKDLWRFGLRHPIRFFKEKSWIDPADEMAKEMAKVIDKEIKAQVLRGFKGEKI